MVGTKVTEVKTWVIPTLNRNLKGKFDKLYTLTYERDINGETTKVSHTMTVDRLEIIGKIINHRANKGTVWNIAVIRNNEDITDEFEHIFD